MWKRGSQEWGVSMWKVVHYCRKNLSCEVSAASSSRSLGLSISNPGKNVPASRGIVSLLRITSGDLFPLPSSQSFLQVFPGMKCPCPQSHRLYQPELPAPSASRPPQSRGAGDCITGCLQVSEPHPAGYRLVNNSQVNRLSKGS